MSRSGVGLGPNCVSTFEELKLKKTYSFIIFKLSDDKKSIIVDKTSNDESYEEFTAALPETDCRYAVYDFKYSLGVAEGDRNKIVFVTWSPDDAPVRSKMVYASSKDALRRSLNGIGTEVQATDFSEVAYETILEKVSKVKSSN